MFVDSSAFVAIISRENDAVELGQALEAAENCVTSSVVVLESAMRLSSKQRATPENMLAAIEDVMAEAEIVLMPLEVQHARLAVEAFSRFGKGRGHPAQLNLSDCLTYACAKARGVPILYKGDDFARTDLG